jgi:ribosomal protein S18 acetylase RimI-like enzyme
VLPEGFLSQLGLDVLIQIYRGAASAPGTPTLVARASERIGGFVLGTRDTRTLFRHVLWRRAHCLVPLLTGAVMRRPRILGRVLESLRYPARLEPVASRADGELVSLGVAPELRGSGCGLALVEALNAAFRRLGVRAYTVSLYEDNDGARAFYERCGFEPVAKLTIFDRPWAVYRLDLGRAEPGPWRR